MGLEKSLTMLSAIVGSLGNAIKHACTRTTESTFAAKSTLIVVPSACESSHIYLHCSLSDSDLFPSADGQLDWRDKQVIGTHSLQLIHER